MDSERDVSTDEYLDTAVQIFDYCNADSNGTLSVETLMEKIAPFVKTNKSESNLRTLLDPEGTNPEISVTMLSNVLNKYSETQKNKVDFEESFNLKSGPVPQDSDSGISSDGFQLLEELQSELTDKRRLASKLRSQLELSEQQHEEALSALLAERDSLRGQLNMIRDENASLSRLRSDFEESSERLAASEGALEEARRALELARRRADNALLQLSKLEEENACLTEQLDNSKKENHRMNDMYAGRQAALRVQSEALRAECAELAARRREAELLARKLAEDKNRLEQELKEQLNRSLGAPRERSLEVSYTEDQLLSALDSLHSDSRFPQDNTLDDLSFLTFNDDPGRPTNMSLYDEIRLSFGNISRLKDIEQAFNGNLTIGMPNDDLDNSEDVTESVLRNKEKELARKEFGLYRKVLENDAKCKDKDLGLNNVDADIELKNIQETQCKKCNIIRQNKKTQCRPNDFGQYNVEIQCDPKDLGQHTIETQCKPKDFGLQNVDTQCGPKDFGLQNVDTQCGPKDFGLQNVDTQCGPKDFGLQNIETQCGPNDFGLQTIETQCKPKDFRLTETQCVHDDFGLRNVNTQCEPKDFDLQNIEAQSADSNPNEFDQHTIDNRCVPSNCGEPTFEILRGPTTLGFPHVKSHSAKNNNNMISMQIQSVKEIETNNNNEQTPCKVCDTCVDCEILKENATKLESEITRTQKLIKDLHFNMDSYEHSLKLLKTLSDEESKANKVLKSSMKGLNSKIEILEKACLEQKTRLERLKCDGTDAESQTCDEVLSASTSTQADVPCAECEIRAAVPKKTWRSRLWDLFSSVLSMLALLCFSGALCFLYQVSQYQFASRRCGARPALPWSWLRLGDLLDALFRVEYVGEVPM